MATKPIIASVGAFFTAGAVLLLFLIILAGIKDHAPLNQLYWIDVDTSKISGAPPTSRWTLWGICEAGSDGRNTNCTSNKAAYPFDPSNNFNTQTGIPSDFIQNRDTYYYLTRFGFPFYIIGLVFAVVSLLFSLLSCLSRLGAALNSVFNFVAFLFIITASSLETATYIMAKQKFNDNGEKATLGVKMIAFTWTATALLLLVLVSNCTICAAGRDRRNGGVFNRESSFEKANLQQTGSRRGFFNVGRRTPVADDEAGYVGDHESQDPVIRSSYERGATPLPQNI